jgi:hypothetical protein
MATYNKKIPQLPEILNPSETGYTVYDDTITTYSLKLGDVVDVKHWLLNESKILEPNKTIVISGNYVLENSSLTVQSSPTQYVISSILFKKEAQVYIGGNLLLINSNIINNGKIYVAGQVITQGFSSITGNPVITY